MDTINLSEINFIGHGLSRPECALAHRSGIIFAPDWTDDGGISVLFPNGDVKRHLVKNWQLLADELGLDEPLRPNGICLLEGGKFLVAHLGAQRGGIFSINPQGHASAILTEIDGEPLPPSNFVTVDEQGRIWITVSTRQTPRALAYRSDVEDGFIVLLKNDEARIVADGLGYTNECLLHPDGKRLFVNETFSRRLTSFDIEPNGDLSNRQTVTDFAAGTFPDGLAFGEDGNAWITSIVSNRVLCVTPDGKVNIVIEDADSDHLQWVEQAWLNHEMGRPHLDKAAGSILRNISNLAFCGETLDQAVLGCLLDQRLATVKMPLRGTQPVHWTFNIEPLITALGSPISSIEK